MKSSTRKTGLFISPRHSQRMTRRVLITTFCVAIALGAIVVFNLSFNKNAKASVAGDYRSVGSGPWMTYTLWEVYDGTAWIAASVAPTSANGTISIRNGNTISTSTSFTVDQIVVDSGGVLNINGGSLTISNGTGNDITVDGTMNVAGGLSMASSSVLQVNNTINCNTGAVISFGASAKINLSQTASFTKNGGTVPTTAGIWNISGSYIHNDQTAIPLATWNSGSTCEVTGSTTALPSNITQSFYHFKWNCAGQTSPLNFSGNLPIVLGDFTLASTGTSYIQFDSQGNNSSFDISGYFYMKGGTVFCCTNGSFHVNVTKDYVQTGGYFAFNRTGGTGYGNISTVMTVMGDALLSGGTMDMSQCTSNNSSKGNGSLNLMRNLTLSGTALITETSAQSRGQVYFAGTTVQYFTTTNPNIITQYIDFTVNSGAILRMDTQVLSSLGDFTLMNGGLLMIGDANGITQTATSGNIQVSGTRTYNIGADYTYNGLTPQNTGDGLPNQVRNLTFDNDKNITLTTSTSVNKNLNFNNGICIANNDTLTLGISTSTLGTLNRVTGHVAGNFRRWVASTVTTNTLFPVGTVSNYNPAYFSFTSAPNAGSIVCKFVRQNPGTLGLPLMDAGLLCYTIGYSYWSLGGMNGFANGQYTVRLDANGFPNVSDYTMLHVLRRTGSDIPWTTNGTHSAGTGSNANPLANRINMTLLGDYGISSNNANPLPIELISFDAKPNSEYVDLGWSTASETNNDYFTVERSTDGINFTKLLTKRGFGSTTERHDYKATDSNPFNGTSYYRLKQTDFDGKSSLSNIVSVHFEKNLTNDNSLKIISVSNFNTGFKMKYNSKPNTTVRILILNISGKLVYETTDKAQENINTYEFNDEKSLASGVYFIQVIAEGQKCIQKIIKES